ncbi:MAG: GtrA family protein [Streptosporangiaceae bacterium]
MNYLLANAIAITVCSLVNFLVSETWVFERKCISWSAVRLAVYPVGVSRPRRR